MKIHLSREDAWAVIHLLSDLQDNLEAHIEGEILADGSFRRSKEEWRVREVQRSRRLYRRAEQIMQAIEWQLDADSIDAVPPITAEDLDQYPGVDFVPKGASTATREGAQA